MAKRHYFLWFPGRYWEGGLEKEVRFWRWGAVLEPLWIQIALSGQLIGMKRGNSFGREMPSAAKDNATTCSLECQLDIDYVLDNYRGASSQVLRHINSILFTDGKIYNLLDRKSPKRRIRCGCVKSNCEAKYCECYRAGETCGEACGCVGCKNRRIHRSGPIGREGQSACNCVKSGCLKKYCECFQNGRKCGRTCRCCDCKNSEEMV